MRKSIIVFSSVDGHTREICEYIANYLDENIDVISLDELPDLEKYQKIIIGASIRYGKYRKNLFDFIKKIIKNFKPLNEKNKALKYEFVSNSGIVIYKAQALKKIEYAINTKYLNHLFYIDSQNFNKKKQLNYEMA